MAELVVLPALGVPTRHYRLLEDELRDRGHGVSTVELMLDDPRSAPHVGYHELLEGPVHETVEAARSASGGGAVALIGHSIGGHLALMYAATHREAVGAVALTAAGTVHWKAFPSPRRLGLLAFTQAIGATATVAGSWPGQLIRFGGHQPRRLMRDWARAARTGRFRPAGAPDRYEPAMRQLDLPLLSVSMPGDDLAPPSAADGLLAQTGATAVTRVELDADRFTRTPGHAGWLKHPAPVVDTVVPWLADLDL